VADKNWLTTPLDSDGLSHVHGAYVKFGRGQGKDIGGRAHGGDEFHNEDASGGCVRESDSREEKVGEGTTFGFGDSIDAVISEGMVDGSEFVEGGGLGGGEGGGDVGRLLERRDGSAKAGGVDGSGGSAGEELRGCPRREAGG